MMDRLPNFLIVGAAKSGTTSLYYYLKEHPEVYMPDIKEPYFFCYWNKTVDFRTKVSIVNDLPTYLSLFMSAKENQVTGEATPYYLYFHKETILNIKRLYTHFYKNYPKILIILRNPIERAFSQYLMHVRDGEEPLSFEKAIMKSTIDYRLKNKWNPGYDYIGFGKYYEQVKDYMDNFEEVKVFLYDDLKKNVMKVIQEIYNFLNVDPNYSPSSVSIKFNVSGIPKSRIIYNLINKPNFLKGVLKPFVPKKFRKNLRAKINEKLLEKNLNISEEAKEYLKDIYYEDILKLQDLINRDLTHWLKEDL